MNAARLGMGAISLSFGLIAVVVGWQLSGGVSYERLLIAAVLTCPLWASLRGLLRRSRRTYAWATLCVIPYFILGVTEAVANPERRAWAGACLVLALALFATLIVYLRATNPERASGR